MNQTLLLDASVWLAAFDANDDHQDEALKLLGDIRFDIAALDLTLYEVANVAIRKWRSLPEANRMTQAITRACEDTLVRADAELLEVAADLAAAHSLTVYDAAYVAANQARSKADWRLVSLDGHLTEPKFAETPADVIADEAAAA